MHTYELIRLTARHKANLGGKLFHYSNLVLLGITPLQNSRIKNENVDIVAIQNEQKEKNVFLDEIHMVVEWKHEYFRLNCHVRPS